MAVRSRRVFGPTLLTLVGTALYTVPADRTLVLRTVTLYNRSAAGSVAFLAVNGITGFEVVLRRAPAAQNDADPAPTLIFNPGDVIYGWCTALNAVIATGFGSLLQGAPE